MSANHHGDSFRNPGSDHIADSGSSQIVKQSRNNLRFYTSSTPGLIEPLDPVSTLFVQKNPRKNFTTPPSLTPVLQ